MALKNEKIKIFIILTIILAVATFFRFWRLNEIPPGLYPDVAINGNDALQTLKTGNFKVFYPENNGREGLMMWLIAASFSIFRVSIWSIKIVAAAIGILTVLGLYLLTKELFGNLTMKQFNNGTIIALLSSFFLAISFWHTNFSRIGFRAILLPFILVFGFYFLFKGLNFFQNKEEGHRLVRGAVHYSILAGIFFGLGFYTYISYRFIVLLIPFVLLCWYFIYQKQELQKKFLLFTFYFLLFTFIVALPIGIYFLQNPHDFVGRAAPISIFVTENPIKEFGKSLVLHLAMFNFYGDPNWRHNFSGSPQLFWPIGILFLIGFFISIKEILSKKPLSLVFSYWLLVIWFFTMLLPGILTVEGTPHSLRVIGVIPVVYIFAAIGSGWSYEKLKIIIKNKKLLIAFCLAFLLFVSLSEFNKYFFLWAKNPNVKGAFTKKFADIGYYLNSLPPETSKYVIVNEPGVPVPWPNGIPMPAQTVMFIENTKFDHRPQSTYLLPENLNDIKIINKGVIVPMKYEESLAEELKKRFPQGEIQEKNGIWIYQIK